MNQALDCIGPTSIMKKPVLNREQVKRIKEKFTLNYDNEKDNKMDT